MLSDEEYGKLLDVMPIVTTDIVVLDEHCRMLLAKRAYLPAEDQRWNIGGRLKRELRPRVNATYTFRREAGITLPPERLRFFGAASLFGALRRQTPQANGSHTVPLLFYVVLSDAEKEAVRLNEEYKAGTALWLSLTDIVNGWVVLCDTRELVRGFHQSIRAYARYFLRRWAWNNDCPM